MFPSTVKHRHRIRRSDMSSFVHLHTHSCFSLLESSASPTQLIEKAIAMGSKAIALTDTNSCSGLYEFNETCIKKGIKPILGVEINVSDDIKKSAEDDGLEKRIILLAKNKIGYKNLCILSSESYTTGGVASRPKIDYRILREFSEGLIMLTGGIDGHLANLIMYRRYETAEKMMNFCKKIFKDDLYIEIGFHPAPNSIASESIERQVYEYCLQLGEKLGIKCICANDVKYCNKTDREYVTQDIMMAIKQHKVLKDDSRKTLPCHEFYMKTREELEVLFPNRPDLFDNTIEIADKIESGLIEKGRSLLPLYEPPNGITPTEFLRSIAYEGLKKRELFDNEEYKKRADYEIRVFEACGFINYFLVLYDFVNWARSAGIPMGPGRGSSAGSLALYCMNITKVDPILYGLLFERFFSVDTKYVVDGKSFGIDIKPSSEKIDVDKISAFTKKCSEHPEFNEQRFNAEEKKMKSSTCFDDFVKLFIGFLESNSLPGKINECNSIIAFYSGLTSERPNGDFEPREELVAARISPPDVDLDFDYHRRDEVFGYLRQKYGVERTAQIGTASYFMGKVAIKDVGKTLDIGDDWERTQEIKDENREKRLKKEKIGDVEKPRVTLNTIDRIADFAETGLSFAEAYAASAELRSKDGIPQNTDYYQYCSQIDGLVRHHGVHAAGMVISNQDIREVMPLRLAKGIVCTQYDKDQVESVGLYKYDLLALMNVSVVAKTMALIKDNRGEEFDIDAVEPNDKAVFDMLNEGKTQGVFQFESYSATELIKMVKLENFYDLVACNAINRPGPLKAGVGDSYARRKNGEEKVDYPHPSMETVLKESHGLIVYQEQIMNLSRVMASFTKSQADKLRKAIGKKNKELMETMRQKFVDGCISNNIEKAIAVEVWQMIEYFGEYGFNKCLSGDTPVFNKIDRKQYTLEELYEHMPDCGVVLDSHKDGELVDDEMIEVFLTGEKELFEVVLSSGSKFKSTIDHKIYCFDGKDYTVEEIIKRDFRLLCGLKIKSIKSIGIHKTYNVTMTGDQHNYSIITSDGSKIVVSNSHSLAYGLLAYQTAFLKRYYPLEYFCALLSSCDDKEKVVKYQLEAQQLGVKLWPVNVNKSMENYIVENGGLRLPLTVVDGVGDAAVKAIIAGRPYPTFDKFVENVDTRVVNIAVVRGLATTTDVSVGAFGVFGIKKPDDAVQMYERFKNDIKKQKINHNRFVAAGLFSGIDIDMKF